MNFMAAFTNQKPQIRKSLVLDQNSPGNSNSPQVLAMATAVSLLTERDWRSLSLELVLGKTWNCTWGVGLAPPHPVNRLQRSCQQSWIRSVGVPHRCRPPFPHTWPDLAMRAWMRNLTNWRQCNQTPIWRTSLKRIPIRTNHLNSLN